jgi:hypothetical protein
MRSTTCRDPVTCFETPDHVTIWMLDVPLIIASVELALLIRKILGMRSALDMHLARQSI